MPYATVQDLIDRFGETEIVQITDRSDPPAYAIDQTVASSALDTASAEMDGYIAAKYQLPLVTISPVLTDLACDIARFRLYAVRATEEVQKRYDAAISRLREISKGTFKLDAAGVEPESRPSVVLTSGPERVFRRDCRGAWR